jgi:hypothetical protein
MINLKKNLNVTHKKMKQDHVISLKLITLVSILGDNSHAFALTIVQETKNMEAAKTVAISKSKHAVISAMRNTYFAVNYDLANSIVPNLHSLCIAQVINTISKTSNFKMQATDKLIT